MIDVECPACGHGGDVRPGTPYPARLQCPYCGATFYEGYEPGPHGAGCEGPICVDVVLVWALEAYR